MMLQARTRQQGTLGHPETSQLLLIVSDGRGLFLEGMDVVKSAVRKARHANVFLVFVIIDNPQNKASLLTFAFVMSGRHTFCAVVDLTKVTNLVTLYFAGFHFGHTSSSFQKCRTNPRDSVIHGSFSFSILCDTERHKLITTHAERRT